jgi:hypothetical protein
VPDGRADQRYRGTAAAEGCAIIADPLGAFLRRSRGVRGHGRQRSTCLRARVAAVWQVPLSALTLAYHASHDLTPVVQATDRNLTPALPHLRTVASGMIRG